MFFESTSRTIKIKSPIVAAYYRHIRRQHVIKLLKPEFWFCGVAICSVRYVLIS